MYFLQWGAFINYKIYEKHTMSMNMGAKVQKRNREIERKNGDRESIKGREERGIQEREY